MLLLIFASAVIAYDHFNLDYWRTPPEIRVDRQWQAEIKKVESKSPKLKKAFLLLKNIEMITTDQQFKDLIDKSKVPFKKVEKGSYTLKIQIMPWIEDMKYGYLIQHEVFDSTDNKISEFNTNIDIGRLW